MADPDNMDSPDGVDINAVRGGAVHSVPFFSRLFGLYKLGSHASFDYNFDDDEEYDLQYAKMMSDWWKTHFTPGANRKERYRIFEEMDRNLTAGILDTFAEECTQIDYDRGRSIWIESSNDGIRRGGETCLINCMLEDRLTAIARGLAKKGDSFKRNVYQTGRGLLGIRNIEAGTIVRVDDKFSRLVGFKEENTRYRGEFKADVSWPWDYTHFRLIGGKNEDSEYGTSILDSLFDPWRKMVLAEDSVLMYRLRRAPDRNLVLVDINNMEEHEAVDYVNSWRKRFRKYEMIDPGSQDYRKQYNPLTPLEDIFMPIRGQNNTTRIENLSGSANQDALADLDHFRRTFFGTARVPQAFMGFEGDINAKATLSTQSIRFANTCKRLQKALIYGVRSMVDMHLVLMDTDGKYDFTRANQQYLVRMAPISALDEFERLELVQLRASILEAMANISQTMGLDPAVWASYLLLNYAKLPEALVLKLLAKPLTKMPSGGGDPNVPEIDPSTRTESMARRIRAHDYMQGIGTSGFYSLTESEQRMVGESVHKSAGLRKILGEIHEYHIDDLAIQQSDPTLLPPRGYDVSDTLDENASIRALQEQLKSLGTKGGGQRAAITD